MADPRFCPACGQALLPGSRFCGRCGGALVPAKRGGAGWKIAFAIAALVAAAAVGWALFLRAKPVPSVPCPKGTCPKVGSEGGQLSVSGAGGLLDKVKLLIERDSIAKPIDVTVAPAPPDTRPPQIADAFNEAADPTPVGPIIQLGPDGTRFTRPIALTLPFDPTKIPAGRTPAVITWGGGHGEVLQPAKIDGDTIQVVTTHFSDAVVVINPGSDAIIVGMPPVYAGPAQLEPTQNPPEEQTCKDLMPAVAQAVADRKYSVYNDPREAWGRFGVPGGERTMLWYLYAEDGGAMSNLATGADQPIKPIRSGSEVAMYKLLKARLHDNAQLTPDQILDLALQAVTRDGRANYAEAVLTALNVIRVIARADKWMGDLVDPKGHPCPPEHLDCGFDPKVNGHYGHPPTDPMMPIFRDAMGADSIDGGPTLMEMLGGKKDQPPSPQFIMQAFDQKRGWFQPIAADGNFIHNGGAHYYHWTGAVAQIYHSEFSATAGATVELVVTKLPSDPAAGFIQTPELLRGVDVARCIEDHPPVTPPCPPKNQVLEKCPWTPEGFEVRPCDPGFCYDGGPQGSLACKQKDTPPGAGRNDLNNIVCPDGSYPAPHAPCSDLHAGCISSAGPPGTGSVGPTPPSP